MAHFAKVKDGVVTQVIVAEPEFFDTFVDSEPGEWIKTSYNVRGGVYHDPETNEPVADQSVINDDEGRMRKNYAGIGFIYDRTRDAFLPPQPFASWVLNETSCLWEAPVAYPEDGEMYAWSEEDYQADNTTGWVQVTEQAA
jgi:hypothetical protein